MCWRRPPHAAQSSPPPAAAAAAHAAARAVRGRHGVARTGGAPWSVHAATRTGHPPGSAAQGSPAQHPAGSAAARLSPAGPRSGRVNMGRAAQAAAQLGPGRAPVCPLHAHMCAACEPVAARAGSARTALASSWVCPSSSSLSPSCACSSSIAACEPVAVPALLLMAVRRPPLGEVGQHASARAHFALAQQLRALAGLLLQLPDCPLVLLHQRLQLTLALCLGVSARGGRGRARWRRRGPRRGGHCVYGALCRPQQLAWQQGAAPHHRVVCACVRARAECSLAIDHLEILPAGAGFAGCSNASV